MVVEKDYRGAETKLAYNDLAFSVPKNLYIIRRMTKEEYFETRIFIDKERNNI